MPEQPIVHSIDEYYISCTIGYGSTGRVKLGIHRVTGNKVAIKIIPRIQLYSSIRITQAIERELAILQLLYHPNLIELYQILEDENNIYFITEYVPGGELYHTLNKSALSEPEARRIFSQIANALAWCHARHICHRDLKPENILLDKDGKNIKIADFGMAIMQPNCKLLKTSCGSPHYVSPEIVRGIPYYGPATDVWSAGIILYVLLTGRLPFDDHHVGRLLAKIKTGRFKQIPVWVSPSAKDLIYRMLPVDPKKRITFHEILSHPWMLPTDSCNSSCTTITTTSNSSNGSLSTLLSIHSFSFRCNPWYDDRLKSPLILNSNDLDGPTRETLKVLWRDLSQGQIISALMEKSPNVQKLTYQLLLQRQKRHLDRLERSTYSMKSNRCDTRQIILNPSGDLTSLFYFYDNQLSEKQGHGSIILETTSPHYQTPALITNLYCGNPINLIYTSRLGHTFYSDNNTVTNLQQYLVSNQCRWVHITISKITAYIKRTVTQTCNRLFRSVFKPSSRSQTYNDTISFYCPANTEFTAAGKLHYILSEQFDGDLTGCMYSDGKVLWSGRMEKDHSISSFICRIKKASSCDTLFKIKFLRCNAVHVYPIIEMLRLYEQESVNVLKANAWDTQIKKE